MKDAIVIDSEFPKGTRDIFYCLYLACVHHMKKISAMVSKTNSRIYVEIVMKWGKILYCQFIIHELKYCRYNTLQSIGEFLQLQKNLFK